LIGEHEKSWARKVAVPQAIVIARVMKTVRRRVLLGKRRRYNRSMEDFINEMQTQ
jgi:hypothetical protein